MVSAGAKVLGSFKIGDNSKIGAGSVVLSEVPPNSTVVGVPGRVVKRNDVRVPQADLNQVDLPDPVKNDFLALEAELESLKYEQKILKSRYNRLRYKMVNNAAKLTIKGSKKGEQKNETI